MFFCLSLVHYNGVRVPTENVTGKRSGFKNNLQLDSGRNIMFQIELRTSKADQFICSRRQSTKLIHLSDQFLVTPLRYNGGRKIRRLKRQHFKTAPPNLRALYIYNDKHDAFEVILHI